MVCLTKGFFMRAGRNAQLLGIVACFAALIHPGWADEAASASSPPPPAEGDQANAPGMKAFVDPQTGRLVREPPPGTAPLELSPAERGWFSTSHQGLGEVPSAVPGGGFKLDLQERFQSPLTATTGPDGNATIEHQHLDGPSRDK